MEINSETTNTPVIFMVPGDLHLTDAMQPNYAVAEWAVAQANDLIRPDFVVFIGDNAQEARPEQYTLFNKLRARLQMPHDALIGDHDVHEDSEAVAFRRFVGGAYGVRALGGVRFLRLDTQQAKPLGIGEEQITWLRDQVDAARALDEQVVLFQHNYPFQIWEDFDGPGMAAWRGIVQTRRIAAIVCGHTHYFQIANDGRNVAVAVRSIGDPEGGEPGYLIGYIRGDDLAFLYRTIQDTGPLALITHPRATLLATGPHHVVSGPDTVRVWTRSKQPLVAVNWRVDRGEWQPLTQNTEGQWEGPLATDGLAKGTHLLEVEAQDTQGQSGRQEIEFMADSTGRYSAVPNAHPVVTQTQFC